MSGAQSLFFCISVLLQAKNFFRLCLWRLAHGSADAATVCQTTFLSWLQALRPLLKEGMWKGHLHPSYKLGLLFVWLGFFKLRFLCLQLWLNRCPMIALKKMGVWYLVVSSAQHMLMSHLSRPLNTYKIMADRKACAHALMCLLSWLDTPLIWHSASREWIWSVWCIWIAQKAELISSMKSNSGRWNNVKDKM